MNEGKTLDITPAQKKEKALLKAEDSIINPGQLLAKAIEKGLGIEALEKLMNLQERWERRQAEKAFYVAMSQFQANKPELVKLKKVDYTTQSGARIKYNFNPLPKIQKKVDPVLSKFGLSYTWKRKITETGLEIIFIVSHIDGHSKENSLPGPFDKSGAKNEIQAVSSTNSYLKRLTLENGLGLSSDDDDDGKKSNGKTSDGSKPPRTIEKLMPLIMKRKTIRELVILYESFTSKERSISNDAFSIRKNEIKSFELDKQAKEEEAK